MALIQPSMEGLIKRPSGVEEKRIEFSGSIQEENFAKFGSKTPTPTPRDSSCNKQVSNAYTSARSSTDTSSKPSSPSDPTDLNTNSKEDQLESTRAEMGEVREENERLKSVLARILNDYESLQFQIVSTIKLQERTKKSGADTSCTTNPRQEMEEEAELVSLSLGTSSSGQKKGENTMPNTSGSKTIKGDDTIMNEGLTLGLDCRFEGSSSSNLAVQPQSNLSPENSSEDPKAEEAGDPWPPSKILKTARSGDDEVSQQVHIKKARVSVRARCDAPTMGDGCQWRKYGQKISKGNPCPRAYYRCTVAPACPVRKQVQRCAEDMSILITTYEGTHNHPLPMAATAMASTTSAAADMLMSGSSTAGRPSMAAPLALSSSTANTAPHCLNFNISDHNSIPRQYYLPPNPAITTSPHHPTITLDLTSPSSSSTNPTTAQFNRFSTNYTSPTAPRYSSTNFNFSSMDSTTPAASPWSTSNGYLGYGSHHQYNNRSNNIVGRPTPQEQFYNQPSYLQKSTTMAARSTAPAAQNNNALTDTIAKAITTDPSFQSALASAITSIVAGGQGKEGGSEGLNYQNLKLGTSASPITSNGAAGANGTSGCATSYMNRVGGSAAAAAAASPQQGSLMFLQPPLGFPNAKSTSASPVENREHTN